jgi:putative nucleotidyltransferase-like protein
VVKGVALATTAYPHVGDRSMGDIDLVVGPDQFDTALDLLAAAGWSEGPSSRRASYAHALSVFDAEGNEIDLHRWVMFPRFCRTPEAWSERAVPFEVAGRPCRRFAFADELVFAVVHGVGPEFTSSIRWSIDAARLIERAAGPMASATERVSFWGDVVAAADELEVGVPVADALSFCAEHLAVPVPRETLAALRASATDRVVRLEWEMQKRGIPRAERIRPFIDTERAAGRRPSIRRYVRGRVDAARQGGGGADMVRRRFDKATRVITSRQQWRRSW